MLGDDELKEIKTLSKPLQQKILDCFSLLERVKKSHWFSTYMAIFNQKHSYEKEILEKAFTVRGDDFEIKLADGEEITEQDVKDAIEKIRNARQESETNMKVLKILPELAKALEEIYPKLTADEKKQVERARAGAAEEILHLHLKQKNGKGN